LKLKAPREAYQGCASKREIVLKRLLIFEVGSKLSQESGELFHCAAEMLQINKGITADEAWDEGIKNFIASLP